MDKSNESLKYADEIDKSFGLAGMAISLMAWDAEEWLEAIDLDAEPDSAMVMSGEFYLAHAPKVGAKAVWEQTLTRFRLTAAMLVANVACRELARRGHSRLDDSTDAALRRALTSEGAELCSLEDDEVSRIYGKALTYCVRLFSHSGVRQLAETLAASLRERRTLPAAEIFALLAPLGRM